MEITIDVVNQTMIINRDRTCLEEGFKPIEIIEGTVEFVKFNFNLTDDWNNLKIFAQFQQGGKAYNNFLDENGSVFLPPEIHAGVCFLILYGSGNTTIATTNCLTLVIGKNLLIKDASSTEISKSLYDQLIDEFNKFKEEMSESSKLADKYAQEANEAAQNANNAAEKALDAAEKALDAAENIESGSIEIASDTKIGGIKAYEKTDAQSLPVGIDTNGFLWVSPLSSDEYDSIIIGGGDSTSV